MIFIKICFSNESVDMAARDHNNFLGNTCKTMIMRVFS